MQNIIIRNATIDDIEKIADIKIEGWQTAYRGIIDDDFLDSMDREKEIEKRRNNIENGVSIVVAELNNEIVGFCLYRNYNNYPEKFKKEADCEISSLYVTSKLKRNGIGRKIMQYVIELLKKEGKTKMILGCLKENYPSRAFYDKMGGKIMDYDEIEFGDKKYGLAIYEYDIVNM
ncbi:MAG: GNAT family N-acetyltransferase [Clostridia bacterium]|nr:GNAT family N-acetyltransferase [Clostridia bacterium]